MYAHRPKEIISGLEAGADCFGHTGHSSAPRYPDDVMDAITARTAQINLGPLFWCPTVKGLFNFEYVKDGGEHLDKDLWHRGLNDTIVADIRRSFEQKIVFPTFSSPR